MALSFDNGPHLPLEYHLERTSGMPDPADFLSSIELRQAVWRESEFSTVVGPSVGDWGDRFESQSEHLFVRKENELIGYARVTVFEEFESLPYQHFARDRESDPLGPISYLSRVAVLPEHQGKGIGRFIAQFTIGYARSHGANTVYGEFTDEYLPIVEKLGFEVLQPRRLGIDCSKTYFTGMFLSRGNNRLFP